jgi:hypothetical protein
MTDDSAERSYWLTRKHVIFITMAMDGDVANEAKVEITEIVAAWWQGRLFSRREAPTVVSLLDDSAGYEEIDLPSPAPVEIAGGVSGMQKHLVALADGNRGLDHAALKQLFDAHQVVVAVWKDPDVVPGPGFLTLKGDEYLFEQVKRRAKKIRATITAIPCSNKQHAELLQQAFMPERAR